MDGKTLQDLWEGASPFLAQMGEKAFNLDQQKRQADLASTLGMEQRNAAMHPLQMKNQEATTRLNESTANLNQYALDTKLPKEQALKQNMQKFFKESDEMTQEQTRMKVQRMYQLAQMAKANGGALPPGFNIPPEEMDRYSPANLDRTIKYGETFFANDPKEIASRQRAVEAERLAKVRSDGQVAVKTAPGAGGGAGGTPKPAKSPQELMTHYTTLANQAKAGSEEQKQYLAMAAAEWQKLQMLAILKAQAPKAGGVDPVGTANSTTGGVVARPAAEPQPMPQAGGAIAPSTGSPAQSRVVKMKAANGTVYDVPANQVEAAKARGWKE